MASGAYNRKKGHNYERQVAKEMRQFFPDAKTSRDGARGEDPRGVDLIHTGMFNIQCKARQNLNSFSVLRDMPDDHNINVVFWKRNHEKDVVVLSKEDFYELLQIIKLEIKTNKL
jgi:hypothetical protein